MARLAGLRRSASAAAACRRCRAPSSLSTSWRIGCTMTGMPAVAHVAEGRRAWRIVRHAGDQRRARSARRRRDRKRVLVPNSAHGTNPATAAFAASPSMTIPAATMAVSMSMRQSQARPRRRRHHAHQPEHLRAVRARNRSAIADAVHEAGAYFYCDGANFNAIVGRVRPGDLGIDAMHINLHKTFSTPHGGGGPGAGPVVLSDALAPFAPLPLLVKDGKRLPLVEHARCAERRSRSAACAPSTARWACSCARSPTC